METDWNQIELGRNRNVNNPGTFDEPFLHIQQAADIMVAGDICYIRQGTYHETVTVNDKDGIDGYPIIFSNYNNEKVLLDGKIGRASCRERV